MSVMTWERCTPAVGATSVSELPAVGFGDTPDEALVEEIHTALMEHQVLVIPNARLSAGQLAALGRALGPVPPSHHSYTTHPDAPDVVVLEWGADDKPDAAEWHADMTYRQQPPFCSLLQAQELPAVGGDTLWASMYAVHDALPPGLREDLAGLEAVHDLGSFRSSSYLAGGRPAMEDAIARAGVAVHPVIAHHPFTGRPYLNVSEAFTRWVIGLSAPESQRLLTMLFDLINRPQFQMRLRWRVGTLALWDNRGTQHYAVDDYLPHRRVMYRVAAATDARTTARSAAPAPAE